MHCAQVQLADAYSYVGYHSTKSHGSGCADLTAADFNTETGAEFPSEWKKTMLEQLLHLYVEGIRPEGSMVAGAMTRAMSQKITLPQINRLAQQMPAEVFCESEVDTQNPYKICDKWWIFLTPPYVPADFKGFVDIESEYPQYTEQFWDWFSSQVNHLCMSGVLQPPRKYRSYYDFSISLRGCIPEWKDIRLAHVIRIVRWARKAKMIGTHVPRRSTEIAALPKTAGNADSCVSSVGELHDMISFILKHRACNGISLGNVGLLVSQCFNKELCLTALGFSDLRDLFAQPLLSKTFAVTDTAVGFCADAQHVCSAADEDVTDMENMSDPVARYESFGTDGHEIHILELHAQTEKAIPMDGIRRGAAGVLKELNHRKVCAYHSMTKGPDVGSNGNDSRNVECYRHVAKNDSITAQSAAPPYVPLNIDTECESQRTLAFQQLQSLAWSEDPSVKSKWFKHVELAREPEQEVTRLAKLCWKLTEQGYNQISMGMAMRI